MANWLGWLLGKSDKGVVEQLGEGVDRFVHTGEEKARETAAYDQEVTKRWVSDSDAPITRLTRPILVIFVTFVTFFFGAMDGNLGSFTIKEAWLDTYTNVWITMIVAYFGSRGFEKVKKSGK